MIQERKTKPVMVLIKILLVLLFFSPFYIALVYSVKSRTEITFTGLAFPTSIHWNNFIEGIETSNFFLALRNSVLVTVPTVILIILTCSMSSYVIARNSSRFYTGMYLMFLGAILIPFQSVMLPLYINLRNLGLLNTLPGLIFTKTGFQTAYTILITTGFVKTVPRTLEEAATIDGLGPYMTFWKIVFPLMKPIMFTAIILNSLYTWNDFIISLVILQKSAVRTLPLTQFYFFSEHSIQLNLAFAVFILSMIPIVILYLVLQRYIISGIMIGAVKG